MDLPIDDYAYDRARDCRKRPTPGALAMVDWLEKNAEGVSWGIMRCERWGKNSASLHAEGRAIDWHLDASRPADRGEVSTAVSGDRLDGDVVVLAVYYPDAREAVEQYRDQLSGKPVVDITNPVNESYDALVVPPDGSATQELAQLAPDARFVKAFNTTFANTLARDGGLNPVDCGAGHRARELEALGLLHMSVQGSLGTGYASTVKILA